MVAAESLVCVVRDGTYVRYARELESAVDAPVDWRYCHELSESALAGVAESADVFIGASLPADVARAAKRLRLVQSTGVGIDRIAVDELPAHVPVATVDCHGRSVAEHVLMAMLCLSRRLLVLDSGLRRGIWLSGSFDREQPMGETLRGKTCGLVGYGTIGREVAQLAARLGMRVGAIRDDASRYSHADSSLELAEGSDGLERLVRWADFLVVSVPLSDRTRGLIGRDQLAWLRPTARLINVARGPVVDEEALYDAVSSRAIAGAALDVWYRYPVDSGPTLPANYPFWELENVVLTPHDSSATDETYRGRVEQIAQNVEAVWRQAPLRGVVGRT